MKKLTGAILAVLMILSLCACGQSAPTWQEQYDLGIKYLEEGNYEEAILAFTAAIEIDPKQPDAYVGRGDAYVFSGETEDNLAAAQADYEEAIALDETNASAYLGLADVYIRRGDYDAALELLKAALEKTGNDQAIADKIAEIESGNITDSAGKTRRSNHFENGELIEYWLYEYDAEENNVRTTCYNADGSLDNIEESTFDADGREVLSVRTSSDENHAVHTEKYEYGADGRRIRETATDSYIDGEEKTYYTLISYDDVARTETHEEYDADGKLSSRFVIEYDEEGVRQKGSSYCINEDGEFYLDYYVEYIWNEDGTYGGFNHIQVASEDAQ